MTGREGVVAIVDDDVSVRRGLERLLRIGGYRVRTFTSAAEFHASDHGQDIACLILDVRMPGPSGLDLQEALKVEAHGIPIVFMSGHGDLGVVVRAMRGGAIDFLTKPVDGRELFDAVKRALARRRIGGRVGA